MKKTIEILGGIAVIVGLFALVILSLLLVILGIIGFVYVIKLKH